MHLGWTLDVQQQGDGVLREALEAEHLQVEDDLGHVLFHVGDGRELMRDAIDLYRGDRSSPKRGEQHTSQRVAERGPESWLERLNVELAVGRRALELADLRDDGHLGVNCQLGA